MTTSTGPGTLATTAAPGAVRRLVVVGGGAGGRATVAAYRDAGGDGQVLLVTDETALPYERPSLSKAFLRGESGEADLALVEPGWYAEHAVGVLTGTRAVRLDVVAWEVVLAGGRREGYDACVLATGGSPLPLPVPGAEHPDVRRLRSLSSARRLRDVASRARRATVIGSGFIGCEAAVSLARRGLEVTLVTDEAIPHAARLGEDAGRRIAGWLAEEGVVLVLGAEVARIDGGRRVVFADRDPVVGDVVLEAAGTRPRADLAEDTGLDLVDGRVPVDERMRTGVPGVLAVGDIALAHNPTAGRRLIVEHWGEALAMGEVAGRTVAGADGAWDSAPGFWSQIGDRTLKHVAWGDGFDSARLVDHGDGGFTVWYGRDGATVGVLTHECDEDYERGRELVQRGAALPV